MYHPDYSLSATAPAPPSYTSPEPAPVLPPPSTGADFTDAWVSQAATATATGAVLSPHQDGHDDWDVGGRPDSGMSGGRYDDDDDDEVDEEEAEEDAEYLDQETVDEFEDRVLNKRAAKVKISQLTSQISLTIFFQLHFRMRKLFEDRNSLSYKDLEKKKDTKKDAAQKFYSLLVLQKVN